MLPHIPLVRSTNAQRRQSDGCGKHLFVLLQSRDNLPSFSVRTSTALKIVDVAQAYPALCARWNPSSFSGDCRSCSENRWMPCWLVGGRNWAFVQMSRGPLGIRNSIWEADGISWILQIHSAGTDLLCNCQVTKTRYSHVSARSSSNCHRPR